MARIRQNRRSVTLVALVVVVVVLLIVNDRTGRCIMFFYLKTHTTTEALLHEESSLSSWSSCSHRDYDSPDIHTGLPFLADVFASHDAQWVYFIAINRGRCDPYFAQSDSFSANEGIAHRFVCSFPDNGDLVLTEYIKFNGSHDAANVVRCRIPSNLQHLVAKPQTSTKLHVDLHAIESSLAAPAVGRGGVRPFPSLSIRDTPKLEHLPVCHAVEPFMSTNNNHNNQTYDMMAMTRIMIGPFHNGYPHNVYGHDGNNTMTLPYDAMLQEWVEHHVRLGINHFLLYIHDKTPNGPLRDVLQPMIDAGLVTYKWFPLDDCIQKEGKYKGLTDARGQTAATLSALHRYGHLTRYMAHMDVDEFFIPIETTLMETMRKHDTYDVVAFQPHLMVPCHNTVIRENETSIVKKWRCWDGYYADQKLIFKPNRIWQYWVHYPISTPEGTKPLTKKLNGETEGLLAHYRRSNDEKWRTDLFSGLVQNGKKLRLKAIDEFEQRNHMD